MMMYKTQFPSDYIFEMINDVVVIYDLDKGGNSVTNDMENVISAIQDKVQNLSDKKIIYRDSDKVFDGVKVNQNGQFLSFYPVRETELSKALIKINADVRAQ